MNPVGFSAQLRSAYVEPERATVHLHLIEVCISKPKDVHEYAPEHQPAEGMVEAGEPAGSMSNEVRHVFDPSFC
jgi:hypothetical protein